MTRKTLCLLLGGAVLALVIVACGTPATPEWAAAAQGTRVALASTSEHETAIAPTLTPTPAPTETPTTIPPTATTIPPTATMEPTTAPTAEVTAAATAEAHVEMPMESMNSDANAAAVAAALAAGNPENGKVLFNTMQPAAGFACATCHSVTPDEARIIGPGLYNVSIHGAAHVPGLNAIEYIHQSIVDPSAFVVPDFPDNLMPKIFSQIFSEQQITDIIAYLATLHD